MLNSGPLFGSLNHRVKQVSVCSHKWKALQNQTKVQTVQHWSRIRSKSDKQACTQYKIKFCEAFLCNYVQGRLNFKASEACITLRSCLKNATIKQQSICMFKWCKSSVYIQCKWEQNCLQDKNKNCKGFPYKYARGRLNFEASEACCVLKHARKMQQSNRRC